MSERGDPRSRPPDPAGTRPKFDPEALRPSGDFRALPVGDPVGNGVERPDSDRAQRLPEPLAASSLPEKPAPPTLAPHAPRFQFLLGAFAALGVAALTIAVSLALAPAPKPGIPWSSWKPSGDVDPAVQIAEHVAPEYTSSPGHLLLGVTGGPQEIGGQPVVVALRSSGSNPVPLEEKGVFYQLCGTGPNCSIPGKASTRRGLLVRREALELALYTFRYVGGVSQVVVTFPPTPPAPTKGSKQAASSSSSSATGTSGAVEGISSGAHIPTRVLLFRPEDLASELSSPLDTTLSPITPTVASVESAPEAPLVNRVTERLVYDSTLIPETQSNPVLLLQQASIGS